MSADRYTRCPHCKATFKVSEEQLGIANGRVRCGACMNIFDAIAYGVSVNAAGQLDPDQATDSPVELEDELIGDEAPTTADIEVFQDDPDADRESESGKAILSDELSSSFLELDENEPDDPYRTEVNAVEEERPASDDESWTQDILNEIKEDEQRKEPHFGEDEIRQEAPPAQHESMDHFQSNSTPIERDPAQFFYEQESPHSMHWLARLGLYLACFALLVLLLAQASWFHYEKLARYPQIARLYAQACELLECKLPELADVSKINSQNLVVRSHPTVRQALIIDTVIVNEAEFAQDFPDIALYFSDINNKVIAQRRIHPHEYLTPEILAWKKMPSEQAIHISLELADPGKEAVNYQLRFFPAEPNSPDGKNN